MDARTDRTPPPTARRESPVARQVLLLQLIVVVVLVATAVALAVVQAARATRAEATDRALVVARTVADAPSVSEALADDDPAAALQVFASRVERDTRVDFVVVMSPDRIRYTHPDPAQVGRRFVGEVGGAPEGRAFTQEYAGTLGPSMRAVVPVLDADDEVVALVAVGIRLERIGAALRAEVGLIALATLPVLAVGLVGATAIARRLRRQTHGLGELELTRMYEYYSAVLAAVREGLLLVDADGVVTLANDEARRLLGLQRDPVGERLDDLGLPPALVDTIAAGATGYDDLYVAGEKILVVSSSPARWRDATVGAVVTLRDRTELQQVTGELDVARGLTDALRAQNHEASNRLHTVVSLVEMGRTAEAVDFATEELQLAQLLADRIAEDAGDPLLGALLLGKSAEAAERGVELRVVGEVPESLSLPSRDLVTVIGNLVDNALDAVAADLPQGRRRQIELAWFDRDAEDRAVLGLRVDDSGPGLSDDDARHALERGWTTKLSAEGSGGRGIGLALVAQVARRHGGEVRIGASHLGGASFVFTAPLASTPTVQEGER